MTESEWFACSDPGPMLAHLRACKENRFRRGRRKLRLFGCACGHRVMRLLSERGRRWLELGEQYADGLLDREQPRQVGMEEFGPRDGQRADHEADLAAWWTLGPDVMIAAEAAARNAAWAIEIEAWLQGADGSNAEATERREQVPVLRDIFGNPFRPASVDPSCMKWSGSTVVKLAQGIYSERAFDRLPILADALEEAGCHDATVINHCRQPGAHVLGCWVVDLLLDKK